MQSNYQNLLIWQKGIKLSLLIYKVTQKFPKEELYGITSQMRRSSVSIPSNIAEGAERNGEKEFKQFLGIAKGSCAELETQMVIAHELHFLDDTDKENIKILIDELLKMIGTLIKKIS